MTSKAYQRASSISANLEATARSHEASHEASLPKFHNLILANPTPGELKQIWRETYNYAKWGKALPLNIEAYVELKEMEAAFKAPRKSYWILVHPNQTPRHVYAYCESLCRPAVIRQKNKVGEDVLSHGISSIFVEARYWGQGYGSRMLKLLTQRLQNWPSDSNQKVGFLVSYPDIEYIVGLYTEHGWHTFPMSRVEFPAFHFQPSDEDLDEMVPTDEELLLRLPCDPELRSLFKLDVERLKTLFNTTSDPIDSQPYPILDQILMPPPQVQCPDTAVAIIPDQEAIAWHLSREAFICRKIFKEGSDLKELKYNSIGDWTPHCRHLISGCKKGRMWVHVARSFHGVSNQTWKDGLHILRLVIEKESLWGKVCWSPSLLSRGAEQLKSIILHARIEAFKWALPNVVLWNPSKLVLDLLEYLYQKEPDFVQGELKTGQTPALMLFWYGDDPPEDIQWIGKEAYVWC